MKPGSFYRLIEDLDFVIPVSSNANRKQRSSGIAPAKNAMASLVSDMPVFEKSEGLTGANRSTQYLGVVKYQSQIDVSPQRLAAITRQVDTRLKTVLRPEDFAHFDIQAALSIVEELAANQSLKILM